MTHGTPAATVMQHNYVMTTASEFLKTFHPPLNQVAQHAQACLVESCNLRQHITCAHADQVCMQVSAKTPYLKQVWHL